MHTRLTTPAAAHVVGVDALVDEQVLGHVVQGSVFDMVNTTDYAMRCAIDQRSKDVE